MSLVPVFLDAVNATRKGVAKTSTLRFLLTQIGSTTSGNKDVLAQRFSRDLQKQNMSRYHEDAAESQRTRILSIDMGIKNLAYCVADVTIPPNSRMSKMNIVAWRRLDVEKEISQQAIGDTTENQVMEDDVEAEANDPYTPWTLANTAYTLLTNTLLVYNPEIILIERQRWRSAGGPSIQQWTVRVNTLEGMLWAVLTALRAESGSMHPNREQKSVDRSYEVFGIDPKRVGNFWVGDEVRALVKQKMKPLSKASSTGEAEPVLSPTKRATQRLSRGKVEKKNKIDLVRTWVTTDTPCMTNNLSDFQSSQATIQFSFEGDAEATRQALCADQRENRRKKAAEMDTKKLDDVADCFLQVSAFVAWEQNKNTIQALFEQVDARSDDADLLPRERADASKNKKKTRKRQSTK